jgi:beta-alanine degradation protein BauB
VIAGSPAQLPQNLREKFLANRGTGRVGTGLVSETEKVRVWHLSLAPGGRIGFYTHFLDYFWTVITGGNARSHYADGSAREVSFTPGDTQHHVYGAGQFMIHDIENIDLTALVFATVEFLDSVNEPLKLDSTADLSKVAWRCLFSALKGRASGPHQRLRPASASRLARFTGHPR